MCFWRISSWRTLPNFVVPRRFWTAQRSTRRRVRNQANCPEVLVELFWSHGESLWYKTMQTYFKHPSRPRFFFFALCLASIGGSTLPPRTEVFWINHFLGLLGFAPSKPTSSNPVRQPMVNWPNRSTDQLRQHRCTLWCLSASVVSPSASPPEMNPSGSNLENLDGPRQAKALFCPPFCCDRVAWLLLVRATKAPQKTIEGAGIVKEFDPERSMTRPEVLSTAPAEPRSNFC